MPSAHEINVQNNRHALLLLHPGELSKWQQLGLDALDRHQIILLPESQCWQRTHAHTDSRTICKMDLPRSRSSLFTLFHEIGHIVHPRGNYRGSGKQSSGTRAEAEYNATAWAVSEMRSLGISVPRKLIAAYDGYIQDKYDRAVRRGLKTFPAGLPNKYKNNSRAHKHNWKPSAHLNPGWATCHTCSICGAWKGTSA